MDNKLSELSRMTPRQIAVYRDRVAISNSDYEPIPVHTGDLRALLAELEASKQYAKERDAENESLALTVGRLRVELYNEGAANAHAYERIAELEKRLATPVRLPPIQHREFLGLKIDSMDAEQVRIAIRAAGFTFTVEGGEQ